MKTKPFYLILFPLLAFGLALSFPIQIHLLYQIPLSDIAKIVSMLTPLNILTMSSLALTGILTITMSKYVYKLIPILLFVLFTNNAIVGLYGTDFTMAQVGLSFVLFGLSLRPFYKAEIKAVILNPRFRWWKTPTRYEMQKTLHLRSKLFDVQSETLNISSSGIFAKVSDKEILESISLDDIIDLQITDGSDIILKAKVVRVNSGHNHQPDGLGLEIIKDENHKNTYLPWFKENTAEVQVTA
jgi:hypothetical protein